MGFGCIICYALGVLKGYTMKKEGNKNEEKH